MDDELEMPKININRPTMPPKDVILPLILFLIICIIIMWCVAVYYYRDANMAYALYNECKNAQARALLW